MNALLQHIQSTLPITDAQLDRIAESLVEKKFTKKEHLLHSGSIAQELFFTISGCARTYVFDYNGQEHNVSFSMENWWIGDLQSFITASPATYHIQALEELQVLSIKQEKWKELIEKAPAFVAYTRILFRNKMFSQQNRIVQNLSFTAKERYDHFLTEYPNLSQRISQKHIASYLGITPEFLSMLRNKKRNWFLKLA